MPSPLPADNACHTTFAAIICTRLVMPLSEDDMNGNQCLTAMSFHFPDEAWKWPREWFGNRSYLDVANSYNVTDSYTEIIR